MDACTAFAIICALLGTYLGADVAAYTDLNMVKTALLSGVSIICIFAFTSAHLQLSGLIGERGVLPIGTSLETMKLFTTSLKAQGAPWYDLDGLMSNMLLLVYEKYYDAKDQTKHIDRVTAIDIMISVLSLVYPHPVLFLYLYVSYYSIKRLGGQFFNFQWDARLLEVLLLTSLLSMSYDRATTAICVNLFKLLLFRLMFGSGIVKYFSGDASWHTNYTAMAYHFLTQPLPNWLGMLVHTKTPAWVFRGMTMGTLVVEGVVPLASLLNIRAINYATAAVYTLLQASIALTGYYGFFNYLTVVLSASLLDDSAIAAALRYFLHASRAEQLLELVSLHGWFSANPSPQRSALSVLSLLSRCLGACIVYPAALLVLCSNAAALYLLVERTGLVSRNPLGEAFLPEGAEAAGATGAVAQPQQHSSLLSLASLRAACYSRLHASLRRLLVLHGTLLQAFYLGSHYGLFANMTKARNEVTVELSRDGVLWQPVEFLAKPGSADLPPKPISPFFHLPRLDWVLWFLAFKPAKELYPRWFWVLLIALMEGDNPAVLGLMHPTLNPGIVVQRGVTAEGAPAVFQYARVSLVNYCFAGRVEGGVARTVATASPAAPTASSGADAGPDAGTGAARPSQGGAQPVQRSTGKYWSTLPVRAILPPTSLADVYALLDSYDAGLQRHRAQRAPPSAETAADIIMRTLFGKLRGKGGQKTKQQ